MNKLMRVIAAALVSSTIGFGSTAQAFPVTEYPAAPQRSERPSSVKRLIKTAMAQEGAPYSYGGTSPAGFDCSGFILWVYSHLGITLPHSSSAQYALGDQAGYQRIHDPDDLRVGDLVFQGSGEVSHAGIYIGDGNFISATSSSGVQVRSLFDSYWGPIWIGGLRVEALYRSGR